MREHGRRRSPARLLAPLALVLSVAATIVVVTNSADSSGEGGSRPTVTRTADQRPPQGRQQRRRQRRASYTVKVNDNLGLISVKTGVSVERLRALNPELDPQNLVVGQRIKLRE